MKCPYYDHPSYLRYLARNMRRSQDNVALYEGEEGSGKSNAAIYDAKLLMELLGKRFDIANDPIITKEHWEESFDAAEKERVYEFDEFENIAFNRNFNTPDQKAFIVLAQQARILRSTMICVMPYLQFADVYFRQGRFRMRTVVRRITDYDVLCALCDRMHEVREATYYWRQRTEDMNTGEVRVSWEEVFTARHCPLALDAPQDWLGYEARKEVAIRENASKGRGRKKKAGDAEKWDDGDREKHRSEEWGSMPMEKKLIAIARAQDMIKGKPRKRSYKPKPKRVKDDPESLFNVDVGIKGNSSDEAAKPGVPVS